MPVLETIWWLSFITLMLYFVVVFRKREVDAPAKDALPSVAGVSIVIAIKNGADLFLENISHIAAQDYPLFEIIVVDDHSDAAERVKLTAGIASFPNTRLVRSDRLPGKKQALMQGIAEARYEYILCTDADCRPASKKWIGVMMQHSRGGDMVLGYSPYTRALGALNRFVRFETIMTGIQYLSWTMLGKPYMGVGRNMLYARSLFHQTDPYASQMHIPYGDDDLWVQKAMTHAPVLVCIDKEAFVFSNAPVSWKDFFRQKHRHLSAARHYAPGAWWKPGLFGMALIVHWALLVFLWAGGQDLLYAGIGFAIGLFVRWRIFERWDNQLDKNETGMWYPLLEPVYALYLAVMGLVTLISKKKTWS